MTLDKRLRKVLIQFWTDAQTANNIHDYERAETAIKKAFVDYGYKRCTQVMGGVHGHILEDDGDSHNILPDISGIKLMTGQEWYDRFQEELTGLKQYNPMRVNFMWSEPTVIEAAKKASSVK